MKRSPLRRTTRVGLASRRRIRRGGKLSLGRSSETLDGWRAAKAHVWARSRGRCEFCRRRLTPPTQDADHVVKRSAGGSDDPTRNLVGLCRACHARRDAPYRQGRLCVESVGPDRFAFSIVYARDKWAARLAGAPSMGLDTEARVSYPRGQEVGHDDEPPTAA